MEENPDGHRIDSWCLALCIAQWEAAGGTDRYRPGSCGRLCLTFIKIEFSKEQHTQSRQQVWVAFMSLCFYDFVPDW